MAEETPQHTNSTQITQFFAHGSDDVNAMRVLMHNVKGISPISYSTALDASIVNDTPVGEQFQFE